MPALRTPAIALLALASTSFPQPQTVCEYAEISTGDLGAGIPYGLNVRLEGDLLAVLAHGPKTGGSPFLPGAGRILIFRLVDGKWTQEGQVRAPVPTDGDGFGASMRWQDGVLYAGAPNEPGPFGTVGRVYEFECVAGVWTQTETIVADPSDSMLLSGALDYGLALDVSEDWLVVGAPSTKGFKGVFGVYRRNGSGWEFHSAQTTSDHPFGGRFGAAIALEGEQLLVSAPIAGDSEGAFEGAVHSFLFDPGTNAWAETDVLTPSDLGLNDVFGEALALEDGLLAIQGDNAIYRWELEGTSWTEVQKLPSLYVGFALEAGDLFAYSSAAGGIEVYEDQAGSWVLKEVIAPVTPLAGEMFGRALDVDGAELAATTLTSNFESVRPVRAFRTDGSLCYSLVRDVRSLSVSAGGTQALELDAGAGAAGQFFGILGSISGVDPGLTVSGRLLPLNLDSYLLQTLQAPGAGPLVGATGVLDDLGRASASVVLATSGDPSLVGLEVHHAFGTFELGDLSTLVFSNSAAVCLDA